MTLIKWYRWVERLHPEIRFSEIRSPGYVCMDVCMYIYFLSNDIIYK